MDSDDSYFRRWLNDPLSVGSYHPIVVQSGTGFLNETPDLTYWRKWLNDPNA